MSETIQATDYGFPVPAYRFDQKNEMFKRALWDPQFQGLVKNYSGVHQPRDKPGYRHEDMAFMEAAWYIERAFGRGNVIHDSGMYSSFRYRIW